MSPFCQPFTSDDRNYAWLWLQIYASLEAAYAALAERLNGSDGNYIFGANPSSLDALLYGHLAFHQAAPVSCPEIQHQVSG